MRLKRNGQKLSAADVSAIQRAHGPRGLVKQLAAQYGVSHSLISMIRSGKRWDVPNWPLIETKLEREFAALISSPSRTLCCASVRPHTIRRASNKFVNNCERSDA